MSAYTHYTHAHANHFSNAFYFPCFTLSICLDAMLCSTLLESFSVYQNQKWRCLEFIMNDDLKRNIREIFCSNALDHWSLHLIWLIHVTMQRKSILVNDITKQIEEMFFFFSMSHCVFFQSVSIVMALNLSGDFIMFLILNHLLLFNRI